MWSPGAMTKHSSRGEMMMKVRVSTPVSTTIVALGVAIFASVASAQQTGTATSSSAMTHVDSTTHCMARRNMNGSDSGAYMNRMDSTNSAMSTGTRSDSTRSYRYCTSRRTRRAARKASTRTSSNSYGNTATSSERIPIHKEAAAAPAPMPDTTTVAVVTPAPVDTTTVVAVAPVDTTTVVDTSTAAGTVGPIMRPRRFTNGFYIGLGAGAAMPAGGARDAYNTGLNVSVPFGWDAPLGPLGFQGDLTYNNFGARSSFRDNGPGDAVALTTVNPQIWSAMADAKFRLPFTGRFIGGGTTGFYLIGGGGVHYIRNYSSTFAITNPATNINDNGVQSANLSSNGSLTRFGVNGGGGVTFGFGATELFVEARYVRMFTSSERTSYVPIVAGLTFR
jgi:hypothetical protein